MSTERKNLVMNTKVQLRAFAAMGALSLLAASWGCVADRPSRNGVFNENQYIRKDFLIRRRRDARPIRAGSSKATVTQASAPNVSAGGIFGLFAGARERGQIRPLRHHAGQAADAQHARDLHDRLSGSKSPEVVNAWPITNVDLKYRVNLDGEKTNFYEENQELDWQVRQWVKINFDKNDLSDVAPLGSS